jgi:hypothetical protein
VHRAAREVHDAVVGLEAQGVVEDGAEVFDAGVALTPHGLLSGATGLASADAGSAARAGWRADNMRSHPPSCSLSSILPESAPLRSPRGVVAAASTGHVALAKPVAPLRVT